MTGFSSQSSNVGGWQVNVDIRSVNGKGLDIRLRLPSGFERIESEAKKRVALHVFRGNLQLSVTINNDETAQSIRVDEQAFQEIANQASALSKKIGIDPPTADGILAVRGVVLADEASSLEITEELEKAVLNAVDSAAAQLASMRQIEGAALGEILNGQLDAIERAVQAAASDEAGTAEAITARLHKQIEALLDGQSDAQLSEERLNAEAALLATKSDIREEIDRMNAHVDAARKLLSAGGAVGRKLDFLSQEFNRETNTICSKSASVSLTATGLELKAVIDQFREQVQNLQ